MPLGAKHFFYSFRYHEDGEISGVFFCDAKSRRDYGLFGDAVSFDTTFRTNNYDMLCAPIVGVNHHGQTSLFGCGLLDGETIDAVKWLFTTFFEVMGGKKPNSIFTDQSAAISNVVNELLPEVHHGLCLWHLSQNAAKKLGSSGYKYFSAQLKACIYDPETTEEFEESWKKLLEDNDLRDNEWLQKTYELKHKWAQVYSRNHFSAGMTTSQRSESINKFLKAYFNHGRIALREFVDMYTKAMQSRREKERKADSSTRNAKRILSSSWSVERDAANTYTRKAFTLFQQELKRTFDFSLELIHEDGNIFTYSAREIEGRKRIRTVTYNRIEENVTCTCRMFEFNGILCSHALKLLRHLELKALPPQYYLKRWTAACSSEDVYDSNREIILNDINSTLTSRYSELSHISQKIVSAGSRDVEIFNKYKSLLLEVKTKIEACQSPTAVDENNKISTEACDSFITNQHEGVSLQAPKKRRAKGSTSKRIRSALETRKRKNTTRTSKEGKSRSNGVELPDDVHSVGVGQLQTMEFF